MVKARPKTSIPISPGLRDILTSRIVAVAALMFPLGRPEYTGIVTLYESGSGTERFLAMRFRDGRDDGGARWWCFSAGCRAWQRWSGGPGMPVPYGEGRLVEVDVAQGCRRVGVLLDAFEELVEFLFEHLTMRLLRFHLLAEDFIAPCLYAL